MMVFVFNEYISCHYNDSASSSIGIDCNNINNNKTHYLRKQLNPKR